MKRGAAKYTLKFSDVPQGEYYIAVRMERMTWQIFHARQGEKKIRIALKRGVPKQQNGWAVIPWTSYDAFNFPRRVSGNLTVDYQVVKEYSKILGCALVKTPEEILSAAETVLPNEKTMKVISEE